MHVPAVYDGCLKGPADVVFRVYEMASSRRDLFHQFLLGEGVLPDRTLCKRKKGAHVRYLNNGKCVKSAMIRGRKEATSHHSDSEAASPHADNPSAFQINQEEQAAAEAVSAEQHSEEQRS